MRTLIALALCVFLSAAAVAQVSTPPAAAVKVDSFGDTEDSDWLARLDNFAITLQDSPGSKGYVAAFYARNKFPGWPLRRANWAVGYLIATRLIPPERLSVVNGGFADETRYELWAAPADAAPPVKRYDPALTMSGEKNPLLFDRFVIYDPSEYDLNYEGYLSLKGRFEPFAAALNADPGLRGCIVGYMKKRHRRGTDRRLAARTKRQLTTAHPVDVRRVVAIGGGRRDERMVELWLVPPGADLPKPTPTKTTRARFPR